MKITKQFLIERGACAPGRNWFTKHFPEGGEHQDVLNALAAEDLADYASWLIEKIGPTEDVLELEQVETEHSVFCAGRISVRGFLRVGKWLLAGGGIDAGEGMGVFAGLNVRVSMHSKYAKVIATARPANLVSGHFEKSSTKAKEAAAK